ncbi:Protein-S-isoprenylcysteine O-methyltransferase [Pleurostoma richardsiae]|uniref:Protein-S-isoprenylcysteine O-methyltransferase n=1 Tax=Pleurostoma richardsiae TaxID=41990 RepID=A0AA38RNA7_9PEZI|nr:Protein-S-isoprenylcysteine O-methyltransferase [Pleurostoma richardsiae]
MDGDSAGPNGRWDENNLPDTAWARNISHDADYYPGEHKSLAGIAVRAFCLGLALAGGVIFTLLILLWTGSPLWRLPFFLSALALFHFLEFWTTAAYNTPAADVGSFLLTANWPAYPIAHSAASLECLVTHFLLPSWYRAPLGSGPLLTAVGLALVVVGQAVRTAAMVQAGTSFNHIVQHRRGRQHALITTGVYAALRHPSYFGFFWWALGTQLVLGNPLCLAAYAAVLWRFFSARVRREEELLVRFFGDEYVVYRKGTRTLIPFLG